MAHLLWKGAVGGSFDGELSGWVARRVCQWVGMRNLEFISMDHLQALIDPSKQFAKDSIRLVKRCTKPDRKEYQKIAVATAVGFAIMGFIGFFVKLIHIPINNIIVGG